VPTRRHPDRHGEHHDERDNDSEEQLTPRQMSADVPRTERSRSASPRRTLSSRCW
jgi:hypothetical protein